MYSSNEIGNTFDEFKKRIPYLSNWGLDHSQSILRLRQPERTVCVRSYHHSNLTVCATYLGIHKLQCHLHHLLSTSSKHWRTYQHAMYVYSQSEAGSLSIHLLRSMDCEWRPKQVSDALMKLQKVKPGERARAGQLVDISEAYSRALQNSCAWDWSGISSSYISLHRPANPSTQSDCTSSHV